MTQPPPPKWKPRIKHPLTETRAQAESKLEDLTQKPNSKEVQDQIADQYAYIIIRKDAVGLGDWAKIKALESKVVDSKVLADDLATALLAKRQHKLATFTDLTEKQKDENLVGLDDGWYISAKAVCAPSGYVNVTQFLRSHKNKILTDHARKHKHNWVIKASAVLVWADQRNMGNAWDWLFDRKLIDPKEIEGLAARYPIMWEPPAAVQSRIVEKMIDGQPVTARETRIGHKVLYDTGAPGPKRTHDTRNGPSGWKPVDPTGPTDPTGPLTDQTEGDD